MTRTEEFIVRSLQRICDIDEESLTEDANIVDELGVDSVDFADLLHEVEKTYHVELPATEWMERIRAGRATTADYFVISKLAREIDASSAPRV